MDSVSLSESIQIVIFISVIVFAAYFFSKSEWWEETKDSKPVKKVLRVLGILLGLIILISIISAIGSAIVPRLRNFSESQERKDIYKFMCSKFSDFCYYNEADKEWRYTVFPKTEQEVGSITPEEKFFTSKEECIDFCYGEWLETEKSVKEEIFSKETVEGLQEKYPELQKSFWHKLSNLLEKL